MARFLHKYQTQADFNTAYNGSEYQEPWVSLTTQNERVDYNKPSYFFEIEIEQYGTEYYLKQFPNDDDGNLPSQAMEIHNEILHAFQNGTPLPNFTIRIKANIQEYGSEAFFGDITNASNNYHDEAGYNFTEYKETANYNASVAFGAYNLNTNEPTWSFEIQIHEL